MIQRDDAKQTPQPLSAPFPYFGGKSRVAPLIWQALGDPGLYIEPFLGSAATLLARPLPADFPGRRLEIVNDADGFVANLWRSIVHKPDAVAKRCDAPLSERDLLARHRGLCEHRRKARLLERMGLDPDYVDATAAGDWLYCKSGWLGGGICDGEWFGPGDPRNHGTCINSTKVPQLNVNGLFARSRRTRVREIIAALAHRLRHVAICCGDWSRIFFPTLIQKHQCGMFIDPPYAHSTGRDASLYRVEKVDNADVEKFCRKMGRQRNVRIVLAGLKGEYRLPDWRVIPWSRSRGYSVGDQMERRHDERLWLSPHCLPVRIPTATRGHAKPSIWRCRRLKRRK